MENSCSSVVTQFKTLDGKNVGPQLELPISSTVLQLEQVVSQLVPKDDNTPYYSFYLQDKEILESLESSLQGRNTESSITITLHPLSLYKVRPVTRNTHTLTGHAQAILNVQFSPDGSQLASVGGDSYVRFWDLNTGLPKFKSMGNHRSHVLCVSWSPDATVLATGDYKGVVCFWNPSKGTLLSQNVVRGHTQWITSISWEPFHVNPKCINVATASKDSSIKVWNGRTNKLVASLTSHTSSVEAIEWGGQGLLYSASRDRTVKIWSMKSGEYKLVKTLTGHGHRINTLALNTSAVCRTGPFSNTPYKQALTDGVEILVTGSDDHTLFLWKDPMNCKSSKRMTGHVQPVNDIKYSPDGRYIASASFDKKIKIWDGKTGEFIATLAGHVGAIYKVSWSHDSRYIVSASKDSTVKLWDFRNPKAPKVTLPGHYDEVYALDWAPSGSNKVASGSKDRTIKIWQH